MTYSRCVLDFISVCIEKKYFYTVNEMIFHNFGYDVIASRLFDISSISVFSEKTKRKKKFSPAELPTNFLISNFCSCF